MSSRAVAEGMVAMAREEAEGDARSWMAETERTVLALGSFDATRGDSPANEGDDPRRSDSTHAGLTAAIGARAVAALDACERMRREEATQEGEGSKDAGAAYAYEGGFTFRRNRDEYVGDVSACQRAIDSGETYEVCLTNELRRTAVERSRVVAFIPLFIVSVGFWSLYQQQFTVMTVYSDKRLNRDLFGWEMPVPWVQSINPIFIIVFAPVFAALWTKLGPRQPATPVKFGIGIVLCGGAEAL